MKAEGRAPKPGTPDEFIRDDEQHKSTRRDEYVRCCEAARVAIAHAAPVCTRFDLRVLMAVLSFTAFYSRLRDRVAVAQLASVVFGNPTENVAGWQRDHVASALRRLHRDGIIEYRPGTGRHAMATIGLYEETRLGSGSDSEGNPPGSRSETRPDSVGKPAITGWHSEELPEKVSERESRALATVEEVQDQDQTPAQTLLGAFIRRGGHDLSLEECEALLARCHSKLGTARGDAFIQGQLNAGARFPSAVDKALESERPRSMHDYDDAMSRRRDEEVMLAALECPDCRGHINGETHRVECIEPKRLAS